MMETPAARELSALLQHALDTDTCPCSETYDHCPECGNVTCRNWKCPTGGSPCPHQEDERAEDDAADREHDERRDRE